MRGAQRGAHRGTATIAAVLLRHRDFFVLVAREAGDDLFNFKDALFNFNAPLSLLQVLDNSEKQGADALHRPVPTPPHPRAHAPRSLPVPAAATA